jgi:uncharacterized protein (DUF1778 family)
LIDQFRIWSMVLASRRAGAGSIPVPQQLNTVKYRIVALEPIMATAARFDLKMDADEKAIVAKAAALLGTTMAGFVRLAAKEKAQVLLDREARLTLTDRDFTAFARALDSAFAPNPALKAALTQVRRRVRRA